MKKILSALLFFTLAWISTAEAANYAGTSVVWQVMSGATAANVNGAGFNPANTHFSTDGVIAGGTGTAATLTPTSSYAPASGDNNAWAFFPVQANVTYAIWCQITSASGGVATLNSAIGACVTIQNNQYVANTVAGVATTATPTLTYGIDYSQQLTARYTAATGANTTTAFTDPTSAWVGTNWIGNFIHIISGTGSPTVGWYECTNEVTGTCTLDRTAGAAGSAMTYYLGGAASLGSSTANQTDANFFIQGGNGATSSTRFFIQGNHTYTIPNAPTTVAGSATWPVITEGYNSLRGDAPTIASGTQPILSMAANAFTIGARNKFSYVTFTGTGANVVTDSGGFVTLFNCKITNKSTSASQIAFGDGGGDCIFAGNEFVSYNGTALTIAGAGSAYGNYIHDSNICISLLSSGDFITNNITAGCTTENILIANSSSSHTINGNTLYGAENKTGIGITLPSTISTVVAMNNIMYGFVSGYGGTSTSNIGVSNYNAFFNNTNNIAGTVSGAYIGANDNTAINPTFVSVAQVTGTTATSSGTTLTDSGKNFTTASVVAGRDYLYVKSGTGATVGIYGITVVGTTTLTTDNTIGTSNAGNLTYQITTGRNWAQTGLVQSTGYPGLFAGGYTNGNLSIGASQYVNAGGGTTGYAWAQ